MSEARVFRGIGVARSMERITSISVRYVGAIAVLWVLGFVVRGWAGWFVVLTPLAGWIGARAWAWHRVSVEIDGGALRYEGASRRSDFEIAITSIASARFDPDDALVLRLADGSERVCADLSPNAAHALSREIGALGVAISSRDAVE